MTFFWFLALLTCQSAELMRWVASVRPSFLSVHLSVRPSDVGYFSCRTVKLRPIIFDVDITHIGTMINCEGGCGAVSCSFFNRCFCGEYTTNAWPDKAMATHAYVCYAARQTTFDIRSIYGSDSLPGQERLHWQSYCMNVEVYGTCYLRPLL